MQSLIKFKKSFIIVILLLTSVIFQWVLLGQDENGIYVPPGMEIKTVDNINVLVPKGARIYKTGGVLQVESVSEYSAREFDALKQRIDTLENGYEILKKDIEDIAARQKT